MSRPEVALEVLEALIRAVPERVAKKLDAAPRIAEGWAWTVGEGADAGERVMVVTGSETVTLPRGGVLQREDVTCTCLLSPRCFHLLAVLTVLPVNHSQAVEAQQGSGAKAVREAVDARPSEGEALTPLQMATAEDGLRGGALVLGDGLSRVSTLRLGDLVRVAHSCRKAGLVRLESAVMAIFEAARALREESPDFSLEQAAVGVAEVLLVATKLVQGGGIGWVGTARRTYHETAALKLAGVGSEPVVAKGYAGVVTYFTDGDRVFAAQEVVPGDDERALHAYDAQLRFGEISLSHREASSAGLLFAVARVSDDHRLGAGKDVTCAAATRDTSLVDRLFSEDVGRQLDRADRGERHGLVFVRGTMRAGRIDLAGGHGGALPLALPIDHPGSGDPQTYRDFTQGIFAGHGHLPRWVTGLTAAQ